MKLQIAYLKAHQHYQLSLTFDTHKTFSQWKWVNSAEISHENNTHRKLLQDAYQRLCSTLQTKDLKKFVNLYHEMINESSNTNGYSDKEFFENMYFEEMLNNANLTLMPFAFSQIKT